jgi:hypothetical protein
MPGFILVQKKLSLYMFCDKLDEASLLPSKKVENTLFLNRHCFFPKKSIMGRCLQYCSLRETRNI